MTGCFKLFCWVLVITDICRVLTCKIVGWPIWCPLTKVRASACNGVTVHTPSTNDIKQCRGWMDGPNSCSELVLADPTWNFNCVKINEFYGNFYHDFMNMNWINVSITFNKGNLRVIAETVLRAVIMLRWHNGVLWSLGIREIITRYLVILLISR